MGRFIEPEDLAPFATIASAKAVEMIADAEAQAILTAPCLATLPDAPAGETPADKAVREAKVAAVKGILRAAVLRWNEAGTGATQTQIAGPFSQTTQFQARRSMFWPVEITDLQKVCTSGEKARAFAVDTVGGGTAHVALCSLLMGGTYCSCGVDIAGEPIYEVD